MTQCQQEATSGVYAGVLAAFVQWLAHRYEEVKANLKAEREKLRLLATHDQQHKRTADIVANLAVGLHWFLTFARDVDAITDPVREALWNKAWAALLNASAQQEAQQSASDPVQRFRDLCSSALASGRAHIGNMNGGEPETDAGAWGWRSEPGQVERRPSGKRIGWTEKDDVFLESDVAFAVTQKLARDQGDTLPITQRTLHKRLKEAGVLASMGTESAHRQTGSESEDERSVG